MKTELKPCPFCRGEAELEEFEPHKHFFVELPEYPGGAMITCQKCGGRLSFSEKGAKEKVIKAWNTRVYPKEVQKAIERDKPRNPVRPKGYSNIECPTCGAHLKQYYEPEEVNVPFCYHCGQRLDWGENES